MAEAGRKLMAAVPRPLRFEVPLRARRQEAQGYAYINPLSIDKVEPPSTEDGDMGCNAYIWVRGSCTRVTEKVERVHDLWLAALNRLDT